MTPDAWISIANKARMRLAQWELTDRESRILDLFVCGSFELGQMVVCVTGLELLCRACAMDKADMSRTISSLVDRGALVEKNYKGERIYEVVLDGTDMPLQAAPAVSSDVLSAREEFLRIQRVRLNGQADASGQARLPMRLDETAEDHAAPGQALRAMLEAGASDNMPVPASSLPVAARCASLGQEASDSMPASRSRAEMSGSMPVSVSQSEASDSMPAFSLPLVGHQQPDPVGGAPTPKTVGGPPTRWWGTNDCLCTRAHESQSKTQSSVNRQSLSLESQTRVRTREGQKLETSDSGCWPFDEESGQLLKQWPFPDGFNEAQRDLWRQLCVEARHGCETSLAQFTQYRLWWIKAIRGDPSGVFNGIGEHRIQRHRGQASSFPCKMIVKSVNVDALRKAGKTETVRS